jgi:hypothetical protein
VKRVTGSILVLAMVLVLFGLGLAAEEKKPDATLKLTEGQVGLGIGWSWGKGVLTYKGKDYPFKVEGLSVVDVGITKAEAEGRVYNLKKRGDFNGKYIAAAAEATFVVGAGEVLLKNDKGVMIHLLPKTQGVNLKLAGEGMKLKLEKAKTR